MPPRMMSVRHDVLKLQRWPAKYYSKIFFLDYAWKTVAKIATDVIAQMEILVSCLVLMAHVEEKANAI